MRSILNLLLVAGCAAAACGVHARQGNDEKFVVVKAAKVITGAGEEIESGEIVIVDGVVRLVGRDLEYPGNAMVIDATDQVVMPGMIHARARLDLPGYNRSGVHADRDVREEVYFEQLDFEDLLKSGFTSVCLHPDGGGIPGVAAIYRTAGPDDARLVKAEAWLRVSMTNPGGDKQTIRNAFKKAREEIAKIEKARQEWEEKQKQEAQKAQAEEKQPAEEDNERESDESGRRGGGQRNPGAGSGAEAPPPAPAQSDVKQEFKPPAIDAAHERLVKILQDEIKLPLVVELNGGSDFLHALDVFEGEDKFDVRYYLGRGAAADYNYVVGELVECKRPLLTVPSTGTLPQTATRYNLAGDLVASGVTFAFVPGSDRGGALEGFRADVAELVRWGLPRTNALAALSLEQAKFLGVEKKLGSIEKDKEADLIFLDGDPLDPLTRVERVMILGEIVWEAQE